MIDIDEYIVYHGYILINISWICAIYMPMEGERGGEEGVDEEEGGEEGGEHGADEGGEDVVPEPHHSRPRWANFVHNLIE